MFKTKAINTNSSLGKLLYATRSKKKLSLTEIEEKTNIRKKYLVALENGDYSVFPGKVYALGFCKKYSEVLGIDFQKSSQMFDNEFALGENREIFFQDRIRSSFISITPKTFMLILGVILAGFLIGYLYYQISLISAPPKLDIIEPREEVVVTIGRIEIIGTTDTDANLKINNQAINLDETGKFSEDIDLTDGLNEIEVVATNRFNKKTIKILKVLKKNETPETTTTTTIL